MHSYTGKQKVPFSQYQDMSCTWIFKLHTEYYRQQILISYIDIQILHCRCSHIFFLPMMNLVAHMDNGELLLCSDVILQLREMQLK